MPVPILRHHEIDLSKVKIAAPQQNKNGGMNANLLYNDQRLIFRTPKMPCPFGIGSFTDKEGRGPTKYSLDFSFRGMENNPEVKGFLEFIQKVDDKVIAAAQANCQAWFGKPMEASVLKALYSPSIRESPPKTGRDGNPIQWPPTFRAKVVYGQTGFNTSAYDIKDKPVEVLSIGKGDSAIAIVEVTGIYFINRRSFGISYRIIQVKVFPTTRMVGCMIDVTPDEAEGEEPAPQVESGPLLTDAKEDDKMDEGEASE